MVLMSGGAEKVLNPFAALTIATGELARTLEGRNNMVLSFNTLEHVLIDLGIDHMAGGAGARGRAGGGAGGGARERASCY